MASSSSLLLSLLDDDDESLSLSDDEDDDESARVMAPLASVLVAAFSASLRETSSDQSSAT